MHGQCNPDGKCPSRTLRMRGSIGRTSVEIVETDWITKVYADLQKGIPLVMSLIIIRDRDIAKKVCTALQH